MLGVLALVLILVWVTDARVLDERLPRFLTLHLALETISIAVCALVFVVAWHGHGAHRRRGPVLLGIAFLCTALLDLLHTLSYAGMPALVTPSSPEKAINFWLAARTFAIGALFAVAVLPARVSISDPAAKRLLAGALAVVTLIAWLGLWFPERWPATFVSGVGLTPFKIGYEAALAGFAAIAAALYYRQARAARASPVPLVRAPRGRTSLYAASATMAMSEGFFMLYADVTDVLNVLGHLYKLIGAAFLYRGLVMSELHSPYAELERAKAELEDIYLHTPCGFHAIGADGRVIEMNDTELGWLGYRRDEVVGQLYVWDLFDGDTAAQVRGRFEEFSRGRDAVDIDVDMRRKDGSTFPIHATANVVRDAKGRFLMARTSVLDLSARRHAERQLATESVRLRLALDAARLGAWAYDAQTDTLIEDQRTIALLGGASANSAQMLARIDPRDRLLLESRIREAFATGSAYECELRVPGPRGDERWIEAHAAPIARADGARASLVGVVRDITERKTAEAALRDLASAREAILEDERRRVARELHDDLGQIFFLLRSDLWRLEQSLPQDAASARSVCTKLDGLVERAIASSRRMIADLRPRALDDDGLLAALRELAADLSEHHAIDITVAGADVADELDPSIATALYRVAQEALSNIVKHAGAKRVRVTLDQHDGELAMAIEDDGCGFDDPERPRRGSFGLLGMRERLLAVGGRLAVSSAAGAGTRVEARVRNESNTSNRPQAPLVGSA